MFYYNYVLLYIIFEVLYKLLKIFLNKLTPPDFFLYKTNITTTNNNIFITIYFILSNKLSSYFLHLLCLQQLLLEPHELLEPLESLELHELLEPLESLELHELLEPHELFEPLELHNLLFLKNEVVSFLLYVSGLKNEVSVFTVIPVLDNLHK